MKVKPLEAIGNSCRFIVDCHNSSMFKPVAYAVDAIALTTFFTCATLFTFF